MLIFMDKRNLYLIGDLSGFTPQVARLVSIMNYVRYTTLSAIKDLTIPELDYLNTTKFKIVTKKTDT